ncbi:MAG TPA: hypothetical protein DDZ51_01790 [Planctomycetaceae bacterium]|nr:hypothetical protein [Planctomycetaceae bacterium]
MQSPEPQVMAEINVFEAKPIDVEIVRLGVELFKADHYYGATLETAVVDVVAALKSVIEFRTECGPESEIGTKLVCCLPGDGAQVTEAQWGLLVAKRNQLGRMLTEEETVEVLKN